MDLTRKIGSRQVLKAIEVAGKVGETVLRVNSSLQPSSAPLRAASTRRRPCRGHSSCCGVVLGACRVDRAVDGRDQNCDGARKPLIMCSASPSSLDSDCIAALILFRRYRSVPGRERLRVSG
jgi:hypothetical protein